MSPTVLYMILTFLMSGKVTVLEDNPQDSSLDFKVRVQQNNEEINNIKNKLKVLAKEKDLLASLNHLKSFKSLDIVIKCVQNLNLLESDGLLEAKMLDCDHNIDEVWKSLQALLFPDEYNVRGEDEDPKVDKIIKQTHKERNQHYLELISETTEPLNSSGDRFLFNTENKTASVQETTFNQTIPQSNGQQRYPRELNEETNGSFQESLLNVTEQVSRYGYKVREYTVQTEDGYILGLHRIEIIDKKNAVKRVPVLLMHGLLLSSAYWLGAGPGSGLAYLLAEDGHDVWLGNARGNYYSRAHASLNPDSSSYWQFSADEHGKYDLPAMIDKVLNETGAEKLNYLGFSQGGGTYFIMCSELPHYCDKTKVMLAIAPSGRHLLTKSPVFRLLCEFSEKNEKALLQAGIHEVLPKNGILQKFSNFFCRKSELALRICEQIIGIVDSHHPGSFTKESILSLFANFPSGTSVHNLARYGQILRSSSIYKFDYGPDKNLQLYGSSRPPLYNLSSVTAPVVVIYGRNDGIVDIGDIKWLIQELPNVIEAFEVEDPLWTHLDMVYSQYVPKLLYPKIKEYLN